METLKLKSNEGLLADLKQLLSKERELLTQILHHLKEVEERKLYLELGYSSLFAFVTEELGYSESAAYRRIEAMRLMKEVPEVEAKIKQGHLTLSVASQVHGFLRNEEKIRKIDKKEKLDLVQKLEGRSTRECEKKLFAVDQETMVGVEKLKQLLFHQNPRGRMDLLFKKLVELGLEKFDPKRRNLKRALKRAKEVQILLPAPEVKVEPVKKAEGDLRKSPSLFPSRSRYISTVVRDKVWQRDEGQCQYKGQNGKVCGARHGLQIDHIQPFSQGGGHAMENLRLLCAKHNRFVFDEQGPKKFTQL